MGWVSYLEDIRDRLNDDLFHMDKTLSTLDTSNHVGDRKYTERARALLHACKKVVSAIDGAIDMATDPQVELVGRLREVEAARDRLQICMNDRDTHINDLRKKIVDSYDRIHKLERELKLVRKDARKSHELIAELGRDDAMMEKMLDQYPPPQH